MTIVYVSDDNYAYLLGISLTSLYENNKEEIDLNVLIIDDGISQKSKGNINNTAKRYGREVKFFTPDVPILMNKMGRWPKNIFYRIFFASIFGNVFKESRILYLDCDTIVADSIRQLWNTDMEGKACAAVYECMGKKHKMKCCLSDDYPYFNSGVLLIDTNKWKELDVEGKVQKLLDLNSETRMEYPDEGIINYLLKDNIKSLKPRYNLTTIKCVFSYKELKMYRKSKFMYSEEEYSEAKDRPCIIHYTNNFLVRRPWIGGIRNEHPFANYFKRYMDKSEWKNIEMPEEHIGIAKKVVRKMYAINGMFCVIVTGFIYSYIKPMKYDKLVLPPK